MSAHQKVHSFLLDIFNRINKIEERTLATGLDFEISISEIHIIDVIGASGSVRISDIARALGVTLATITVACERLERRELITRTRGQKDKRVVLVSLTSKGEAAYQFHEAFHHNLIDSALADLSQEEQNQLASALEKIEAFLTQY